MKIVLAYVIVKTLSQFVLTAGVYIGLIPGGIISAIFMWLPRKTWMAIQGLICGITGTVLSISVAFFVFRWLVGPNSFGVMNFLVATIPLAVPIYNDYKKASELGDLREELPPRVAFEAYPMTMTSKTLVLGEFIGIALAGTYFLKIMTN